MQIESAGDYGVNIQKYSQVRIPNFRRTSNVGSAYRKAGCTRKTTLLWTLAGDFPRLLS